MPSVCSPICGDGRVVSGEVCDDGDLIANNGCNSTCLSPSLGYTCSGGSLTTKSVCVSTCGDGVKTISEGCDDFNSVSLDGCDSLCIVETGWTCNGASPTVCTANCGDA